MNTGIQKLKECEGKTLVKVIPVVAGEYSNDVFDFILRFEDGSEVNIKEGASAGHIEITNGGEDEKDIY
jgi:hypothetical protein